MKTSLGTNGVAEVTMNYCQNLAEKNNYSYVVCDSKEATKKNYEKICRSQNWKIYYFPSPVSHFFLYCRNLSKLMQEKTYDVYHINGNSCLMYIDVIIARKNGLKVITHCHNSSNRFKTLHHILKPLMSASKIIKVACSKEAGNWAYGKKHFIVVNNAIDYEKFSFCADNRYNTRKRLGISDDKYLILQVGSFGYEKNQEFTVDIFKTLYRLNSNIRLIFCGSGRDEKKIQNIVQKEHLDHVVFFYGTTNHVEYLYHASDLLLQPSLFEGLPLTVLEAQVSDLPCFVSDSITKECAISDHIKFINLQKKEEWIAAVNRQAKRQRIRQTVHNLDISNQYDIRAQAKKLEKIYEYSIKR